MLSGELWIAARLGTPTESPVFAILDRDNDAVYASRADDTIETFVVAYRAGELTPICDSPCTPYSAFLTLHSPTLRFSLSTAVLLLQTIKCVADILLTPPHHCLRFLSA